MEKQGLKELKDQEEQTNLDQEQEQGETNEEQK